MGPYLIKKIHSKIGLSPMIVFGVMLIAMMPIALAFNPYFYVIVVANALAIIGSAITGTAHGLLAQKILNPQEAKMYFTGISILGSILFIIFVPLGALYANAMGMTALFKLMAAVLFFVITPLNFIVVILFTRKKVAPRTSPTLVV
jgi:hypothetical protein